VACKSFDENRVNSKFISHEDLRTFVTAWLLLHCLSLPSRLPMWAGIAQSV